MRLFEVFIIIFLSITLLNYYVTKNQKLTWLLPAVTLLFCLLNIILEGYRTQMLPAFIFTGVIVIVHILSSLKINMIKNKKLKVSFIIVNFLFLIISFLPPFIMPVFTMPKPTGSYAIGTKSFHFIDTTRPEIFTDHPSDHRELSVQVWYPADKVDDQKPVKYFSNKKLVSAFRKLMPIPFGLEYLTLIDTHSYEDVPLSTKEEKYPVILFSHGYTGSVRQNTVQMEELASHGYIVFSIGHTYEAVAVEFPNDQIIGFDKKQIDLFSNELTKSVNKESIKENGIAAAVSMSLDKAKISDRSIRLWTADTIFIANEIEKLETGEKESIFQNRLDMDKLGVFGHSFGGATAGQTLLMDKRFKAGINMDGGQFGDLRENIISQPFMLMQSSVSDGSLIVGYHQEQNMYNIRVSGTKHFSYTDMSIYSPMYKWAGIIGDTNGHRMQKIMNDYILSFFNQYLKGEDSPLLKNNNKYKEVQLEYK